MPNTACGHAPTRTRVVVWTTLSGARIPVHAMSDQHAKNALAMVLRKACMRPRIDVAAMPGDLARERLSRLVERRRAAALPEFDALADKLEFG